MALRGVVLGKPLTTNGVYKIRAIGTGRKAFATMYMSAEGKRWKEQIAKVMGEAMRAGGFKAPHEGPVEVEICTYFPTLRGDCDGPAKPILDAMQGVVYKNDSQISACFLYKYKDKDNPRIEIAVRDTATAPVCSSGWNIPEFTLNHEAN